MTYPENGNNPRGKMLSVAEAARQLGLSANSTRKITKGRDGRHDYRLPESRKPIIKIEQRLVDEILSQSGPFAQRRGVK